MTDEMEYKGYTIKISQDDCEESPREWGNLGTMCLFHSRMNLGDSREAIIAAVHDAAQNIPIFINDQDYWVEDLVNNPRVFYEWARTSQDVAVMIPINAYEHGGITISSGHGYPFCDPWDGGQLGFIFVGKSKVRKEYSKQRISKQLLAKVAQYLEGEIRTYDQFLTGDVWGYQILSPDGDEMDGSCWGFYGQEYAIQEAKEMIDWYIAQDESAARISAAFDQE